MTTSRAVLIAGVLIAAAIVLTNRYAFVGGGESAWRLDRLTGEVVMCLPLRGCKTPERIMER